jgi:type IV fimbrial biogenesis protein FimT
VYAENSKQQAIYVVLLPLHSMLHRNHAACHPSAKGLAARGFTLVELLVTVTLAVGIAAMAVPNMQQFSAKTVVRAEADAVASALRNARAEAIRSRVQVSVCPTNAQVTRSDTYTFQVCRTADGIWDFGWQAVRTQNVADGSTRPIEPNLLSFRAQADPKVDILSTGFDSHVVIFSPSGNLVSAPGTLTVTSTQVRTIVSTVTVSASGLIEATLP